MLIRGNLGTTGEKAFWISTASLELLFLLTTPVTHGIMYFDKDLNYQHGVLMPVLYAFACMILAYALILFMSHRDILSSFQMATNITFLSLMLVVIVFQALRPDILIESFGAAISFLMMNVALDNPATYSIKTHIAIIRRRLTAWSTDA